MTSVILLLYCQNQVLIIRLFRCSTFVRCLWSLIFFVLYFYQIVSVTHFLLPVPVPDAVLVLVYVAVILLLSPSALVVTHSSVSHLYTRAMPGLKRGDSEDEFESDVDGQIRTRRAEKTPKGYRPKVRVVLFSELFLFLLCEYFVIFNFFLFFFGGGTFYLV